MSTATAAAESAPAAPAGKKGGLLKMLIAMLVAAGAAGGGAYFLMSKQAAAQAAAKAAAGDEESADAPAEESHGGDHGEGHGAAPSGTAGASAADFFALAPQFVVNLNDPEAMRFLQVEVQVIAKKAAAMEAVKLNDPLVRNRLMLLFSTQTYQGLLSREGKEKLQADALAEINKVLDEQKKPHINGVVFTNFVMQ
jgi:flagellar FliL protein